MSIYRKIHVRIWGDAKFRSLSIDGKLVLLYLLTGPETIAVPGLLRCSAGDIATGAGLSRRRASRALNEIIAAGIATESVTDRVVFLKNGTKFNPPANPNIVVGWAKACGHLPESDMTVTIVRSIYETLAQIDSEKAQEIPSVKRYANIFMAKVLETLGGTSFATSFETSPDTSERHTVSSEQRTVKEKRKKESHDPASGAPPVAEAAPVSIAPSPLPKKRSPKKQPKHSPPPEWTPDHEERLAGLHRKWVEVSGIARARLSRPLVEAGAKLRAVAIEAFESGYTDDDIVACMRGMFVDKFRKANPGSQRFDLCFRPNNIESLSRAEDAQRAKRQDRDGDLCHTEQREMRPWTYDKRTGQKVYLTPIAEQPDPGGNGKLIGEDFFSLPHDAPVL